MPIIPPPVTLEDFKEVRRTITGLMFNKGIDKDMLRTLRKKLAIVNQKIKELTNQHLIP